MNDAKRKVKVAVISDVHLGFIGCRAKELNRYLNSIEPETLIINGDFIDIWQFRSYYFPKSHSKVIEHVFKFISQGIKVHLLTGNHDEMFRRYSGLKLGNLTLEDKLVLNMDGKRHWFFHGDIFDVSMQGSRWLAKLGTTGYEILILINKLVNFILEMMGREKTSFSQQVKKATKKGIKMLSNYELTAAEIALDEGYDFVLNGHTHMPCIKPITTERGTVMYLNSGDWVENMTALEYNDGEWKLVWYKDLKFPATWLQVEEEDLP
ncbi:MAG TPA: UDP-2,3-diacylglucosamine diphosphatase [Chitinophagales bacterium]|nr:UDP-2,3-diacylglucosamine diphosphatase [Chitinophagales bacterium]